jgi:hypothetical protein
VLTLSLSGPTSGVASLPCERYRVSFTDLASGVYSIVAELDGVQVSWSLSVGGGLTQDEVDMGACKFGGCGAFSVGCVDDGVCTPDDDCVCADCSATENCNYCPNDSVCEPYYEGCACADCSGETECLP